MGEAARPLTRWVKAIRGLATRGDTNHVPENVAKAHALEQQGQVEAALTAWRSLQGVAGRDAAIKRLELDIVARDHEARHWVTAARRLAQIYQENPKDFEIRKELEYVAETGAQEMQAQSKWADACVLWFVLSTLRPDKGGSLRPQDEKIDRNIARCAQKGARAAEAASDWENAAQLWDYLRIVEPYSEVASKGVERCVKKLVAAFGRQGSLPAVVASPPDHLGIQPQGWKVDLLLSLGRAREAADLLAVLEARPGANSTTFRQRARICFYSGKFVETAEAAKTAIYLSQMEGENLALISDCLTMATGALCALQRHEEARVLLIQNLQDREALGDRDFAALYATARDKKDLDEVRQFLWKSFDPTHKDHLRALKHYSVALRDLGYMDEAVAVARKRFLTGTERSAFGQTSPSSDDNWSPAARLALLDLKTDMDFGGFEFFLISGTLLGCIREGDILKHDKDIDVGVMSSVDLNAMKAHLQTSGRFQIKYLPLETVARAIHCNGTSIDFFIHWPEDGKLVHQGQKAKWWNAPFTLVSHKFLGSTFLVPSDPELCLSENYADWRAPLQDWDTFVDTPNMTIADKGHLIWYYYSRLYDYYLSGKGTCFQKVWEALNSVAKVDAEVTAVADEVLKVIIKPGQNGEVASR